MNVPVSSGLPNFPQGASGVVFEHGVIAPQLVTVMWPLWRINQFGTEFLTGE
jgi:hypothetical protein